MLVEVRAKARDICELVKCECPDGARLLSNKRCSLRRARHSDLSGLATESYFGKLAWILVIEKEVLRRRDRPVLLRHRVPSILRLVPSTPP
jgi:hypothetical protein